MKIGQGVLYVYRPAQRDLAIMSAVFYIDGQQVTILEIGGFAAIPISAGQHKVGHQWRAGIFGNENLNSRPIFATVNIQEGQPTYVRLVAQARQEATRSPYEFKTNYRWNLEEVRGDVALPEIQLTKGTPIEPQR